MSVRKRILNVLAYPTLLTYVLPVLMMYLIIGTVAQKYIGLYAATQIFFAEWIIWIGFFPLPGLPVFLVLIALNLSCKLFLKSPWHIKNIGTILTHFSVLFLIVGGALTLSFAREGYVDLAPGERQAHVSDFHARAFVLVNAQNETYFKYNHQDLRAGDTFKIAGSDTTIDILEECRNCKIEPREATDTRYIGMAQHMQIVPETLRVEDEENLAGLTFRVRNGQADFIYTVLEHVPQHPEITIDGQTYRFILRRAQRPLPFSVELINFEKHTHPGTDVAKSYQSRVRIIDGTAQWESLISMNNPLRYKGYTLYQSSFLEEQGGDISVLAVVENSGRLFPYISGLLLCLGILLHLFMRRQKNV